MASKAKFEAQNPLILRCHRLMEAFAKADDERDFALDRQEGFLIYIDLDKSQEELDILFKELNSQPDRYAPIPKLTFYETKKIMEGFVNEKVYDIDTKEKLLDIIQSKEARENFLEFVYDHHSEFEKWQQYYQERSRIRIIEWLRNNNFHFVFEEDLDLAKSVVEKLKLNLFETKVGKDILNARKILFTKAKTYYSNEALNPRPKRGRPPKQAIKQEIEPQFTGDFYISVSIPIRPFLFTPDHHGSSNAFSFSSKFESEESLLASRRQTQSERAIRIEDFQTKLESLRSLSSSWAKVDHGPVASQKPQGKKILKSQRIEDEWDDEEDNEEKLDVKEKFVPKAAAKQPPKKPTPPPPPAKKAPPPKPFKKAPPPPPPPPKKKPLPKPPIKKPPPKKKPPVKAPPVPANKGRPKGSTKKKRIIRR